MEFGIDLIAGLRSELGVGTGGASPVADDGTARGRAAWAGLHARLAAEHAARREQAAVSASPLHHTGGFAQLAEIGAETTSSGTAEYGSSSVNPMTSAVSKPTNPIVSVIAGHSEFGGRGQ